MGVQGLLLLLKPHIKEVNLKKYRGQTCVIDAMGWLYRGAFSTAYAKGQHQHTSLGYMGFPLKMLKLLLSFDIRPICIFDGRPHAGKLETEKKRGNDKIKNKNMAQQLDQQGDRAEARKHHTRSLVIKSRQVDLFEEVLDMLEIEHFTAPYEADS